MTLVHHPRHLRDRVAIFALRAMISLGGRSPMGPADRASYDKMVSRTRPARNVVYEKDALGGVPGLWCRPAGATGGAILYHHGGAYVLGSAEGYRNFAGQLASRVGAPVFVADYALAPERPFPAAVEDALAAYRGLATRVDGPIALAGDSAGGGLTLVLLALASEDPLLPRPAGAFAASPWTDLALEGRSLETRAGVDPFLTRAMLADAATLYLGDQRRRHPRASPLYGDLSGLPPVLIHVGDDEILLDDSVRYARRFEEAGGIAAVHVWKGMPHVFCGLVGMLKAAPEALDLAAAFIRDVMHGSREYDRHARGPERFHESGRTGR